MNGNAKRIDFAVKCIELCAPNGQRGTAPPPVVRAVRACGGHRGTHPTMDGQNAGHVYNGNTGLAGLAILSESRRAARLWCRGGPP